MPTALEGSTKSKQASILDDPARFKAGASTLAIDRFMTRFIRVGGISLIAAVFAIFLFIFWQILPLFQSASIEKIQTLDAPVGRYQTIGVDEWSELPFLLDDSGKLVFVPVHDPSAVQTPPIPFESPKGVTSFRYKPAEQGIIYGSDDGHFSWVTVNYDADFETKKRVVRPDLKATPWFKLGSEQESARAVDFGTFGPEMLAAAVLDQNGEWRAVAARLTQEQTLFGEGELQVRDQYDFTSQLTSRPVDVLVNSAADGVLFSTEDGTVSYFHRTGDEFELRQTFEPFKDLPQKRIASMNFLFGASSVIFTGAEGENRQFSLFTPKGADKRVFGQVKQFKKLQSGAEFYAPSLRNKAFLLGTGDTASLRYATTGAVRWERQLPFRTLSAVISGKFERILFLDHSGRIHIYALHDPHPEASFQAFFGKIWYEGASEPRYEWQSTGGSDEFEPKLSMIPLIFGTIKGTLFAMLFAVPVALLAAVYTSQFLAPRIRAIAKPTMEIMASLPSVVLGFLAALWLAPLIEKKVPSILLMCLVVPACAFGMGLVFQSLPVRVRNWARSGFEFVILTPVLFLAVWACWQAGPLLDRLFFAGDFRLWWPQVTGTPFEQRNSLAVGYMMGFAVIPIIFTIAEDSLSNVPEYLRSGSLALGASRWQTALFVVLPTAFPGIFSALMVGLGRAIGETMIVVMATGNTPVMDFNIFSGMRTLSANIAVELPEAPHHGTLYRTLFLGALVLFMATFVVNTAAEILRQHIREKYRTV